MDTGAFELFGPLHVGRLIEARLDLDEHGNLLAAIGRLHEAPDDCAVAARPVQRHLDRLHLRVVRSLRDELLDAA